MGSKVRRISDIKVKSDTEKAKLYLAVRHELQKRPMTIEELTEVVPFPRARITQACQTMCAIGEAHIGSYPYGAAGNRLRCYHYGPGKDVPAPNANLRKNNPRLPARILAALDAPMTVKDVMQKVRYTRTAIQHIMQLLCASGTVEICGRVVKPGGTALVYRTASFKRTVGVEERVVIPHNLSNASCDAENV